MVSMADLKALSGDGFDDVFSYSPSPPPCMSPTKELPAQTFSPNSPNAGCSGKSNETENNFMAWDEKKLQSVKEDSFHPTYKVVMEE